MPVTVPHGHLLTELSVPIKGLLDGGVHDTRIRFHGPPQDRFHSTPMSWKCQPEFLSENRRGANPTRPHERYREAPLREARRAAPDWARASAALSSIENSRFSRGTEPLQRKIYCSVNQSYFVREIGSRIHQRKQSCFRIHSGPFFSPSIARQRGCGSGTVGVDVLPS
jgi:hypothetical protein